ncbi:hypothetical protein [Nocardioides marinquilinus]|uniref:hypothetical protein n=1 Tax=Nocardioides marinquilinus TaxID=1210400 RepID=UPI0031EA2B37
MTGDFGSPEVYAGTGEDAVVVELVDYADTYTSLGPGDDTFVGGDGPDVVGAVVRAFVDEGGDDTIRTRGGDDVVAVGTRRAGPAVTADVDLGAGNDLLRVDQSGALATSSLRGGGGQDVLSAWVGPETTQAAIDLPARRATADGRVVASGWEGFEAFVSTQANRGAGGTERGARLVVVGTAGDDVVRSDSAVRTTGDLRGGDDVISVVGETDLDLGPGDDWARVEQVGTGAGRIDGGTGRDRIGASAPYARPWLDLGRRTLTRVGRPAPAVAVVGFEDGDVYSSAGRLTGDGLENVLRAQCGRIDGGGGDDVLTQRRFVATTSTDPFAALTTVPDTGRSTCAAFRADGGPGDDRLGGSDGNDVLLGGPGRDRANGYAGRDRCEAEVRRGCEPR